MERCDALGRVSEEEGLLVRPYGTEAMRRANEVVARWMREVGMDVVRVDAVGNLVGRYEGTGGGTFLLGSHLDTVRDAGRYDGPLGVLVALACVERLHARHERLPFAVEVVAFADEEGLRFGTAFLGSSAFAGSFDPDLLVRKDERGVSLAEAIRAFGGAPGEIADATRDPRDLLGYCEVHIEQGPVLEERGAPVGVVSGISGQSRARLEFVGEAGHAGTVPMRGRSDALCAASEFVLAVQKVARAEAGAVATVGELAVYPGASNVIPGRASLSLDVRHADDRVREGLGRVLRERADEISSLHGCGLYWEAVGGSATVPMDAGLSGLLGEAITGLGHPLEVLPSGAGHDAVSLSGIAPTAMLFVRCRGGISHSPAESVGKRDVGVAINTTERFLRLVAESR